MPMCSTEPQDDRGEALFANVEMGVGIFFKIAIVFFLSVRYNRTAYIAGWHAHRHQQLHFFIRVEIKYIICSITCS